MIVFVYGGDLVRILVSASSWTARLLSLTILLLSLAPLGSIYFFLFRLGLITDPDLAAQHEHEQSGGAVDAQQDASIMLTHTNMTLEELWATLFLERNPHNGGAVGARAVAGGTTGFLFSYPYLPIMNNNNNNSREPSLYYHIKLLLPWLVSFVLGVVIPAGLSIWSFFRHRRLRQTRKQKRQSRYKQTVRILQAYTKQLEKSDCILFKKEESNSSPLDMTRSELKGEAAAELEIQKWRLPVPGRSNRREPTCGKGIRFKPKRRESEKRHHQQQQEEEEQVTSPCESSSSSSYYRILTAGQQDCAICLNAYQLHDRVVWSNNPACSHVFHYDCIMGWLSRKGAYQQQQRQRERNRDRDRDRDRYPDPICPCCRQAFCLLDDPQGEAAMQKGET